MPTFPRVADAAPTDQFLTAYDIAHLATYLRLLDADAESAAWEEVARIVLDLDPEIDPARSKRIWASHLGRAKWIAALGDDLLLDADLWKADRPRHH